MKNVAYLSLVFCGLTIGSLGQAQEKVVKTKLSKAALGAELRTMEDQQYIPTDLKIDASGNDVKFDVTFEKIDLGYNLRIDVELPALGNDVADARRHGGVRYVRVQGYVVGNQRRFAFLAHVGPKQSAPPPVVLWDVPAADFARIHETEKRKGGKLIDSSTYKKTGTDHHTMVFAPQ